MIGDLCFATDLRPRPRRLPRRAASARARSSTGRRWARLSTARRTARRAASALERLAGELRERELDALLVQSPLRPALPHGLHRQQRAGADRGARRRALGGAHRVPHRLPLRDPVGPAGARGVRAARSSPASCSTRIGRGAARRVPARLGFDDDEPHGRRPPRLGELLPAGWELVPCGGRRRAAARRQGRGRDRAASAPRPQLADEALQRGARSEGSSDAPSARSRSTSSCAMRRLGAEGPSFPSIVAAGAHGALPHAAAARAGDPARRARDDRLGRAARGLLLGLHAHLRHRRGHLRRAPARCTSSCSRRSSPGSTAVSAGPSGREVDAVAREVIERRGHGEHFGHGLGHGVGMEIHEGPRLSRTAAEEPAAGRQRRHGRARRLPARGAGRADRGPRRRQRGRLTRC